jgi:hypothetical protein
MVNRDDPLSIRCAQALKALLHELRSTSSLCTLRYYKVRLGGVEAKNFVLIEMGAWDVGSQWRNRLPDKGGRFCFGKGRLDEETH